MKRQDSIRQGLQNVAGRISSAAWMLLHHPAPRAFGVLLYHRISPQFSGVSHPTQNVPPERFRSQLIGLRRLGHEFWSLSRVLKCLREGVSIPPWAVVVTFDDGFENNFVHALPVLSELQVPATVFLATEFLDSGRPFPFDAWGVASCDVAPSESWCPLATSQCQRMLETGLIEFGAHTHSHEDFRGRPHELAGDLKTNLEVLQQLFGLENVPFAFPFGNPRAGYASQDLMNVSRAAGVTCAFTTQSTPAGLTTNPFGWGRFNVYEWDTDRTVAAKLAGLYAWAPQFRGWLPRWDGHRLNRGDRGDTGVRHPVETIGVH